MESRLDRTLGAVELTAAGLLAVITALSFAVVVLRYAFNVAVPDGFDFARNMLGVMIFWGIALASWRNDHIAVDLVWSAAGPRLRRALDVANGVIMLGCMAVFCWMMARKVLSTQASGLVTSDLRWPVWPYYLFAWLGLAAAVVLLALRVVRLATGRAVASVDPGFRD